MTTSLKSKSGLTLGEGFAIGIALTYVASMIVYLVVLIRDHGKLSSTITSQQKSLSQIFIYVTMGLCLIAAGLAVFILVMKKRTPNIVKIAFIFLAGLAAIFGIVVSVLWINIYGTENNGIDNSKMRRIISIVVAVISGIALLYFYTLLYRTIEIRSEKPVAAPVPLRAVAPPPAPPQNFGIFIGPGSSSANVTPTPVAPITRSITPGTTA